MNGPDSGLDDAAAAAAAAAATADSEAPSVPKSLQGEGLETLTRKLKGRLTSATVVGILVPGPAQAVTVTPSQSLSLGVTRPRRRPDSEATATLTVSLAVTRAGPGGSLSLLVGLAPGGPGSGQPCLPRNLNLKFESFHGPEYSSCWNREH